MRLPHAISLTCREGPISDMLADLAVHKVDIVLSDTPVNSQFSVRAYNHVLGESGISFFARSNQARQYRKHFPFSLHDAPMLLPTEQNAIRLQFDAWCRDQGIFPKISGQFDDSALMKAFAQAGAGVFFMSSVIEDEICRNFDVKVIGRISEIKQKYYAITVERKVKHPAVAAICDSARQLFD